MDKKRKNARLHREAPLAPEQLLKRENIVASAEVPEDIKSRLSSRRILISGLRQPIVPAWSETKPGRKGRTSEMIIPNNAVIGLPGQTAHRIARPGGKRSGSRTVIEGFRPKWANHVYHPKRDVVPHWAQKQASAGGMTGEVYYGVFGNDDRAVYYPSGYPWQCVGKILVYNDAKAIAPAWWGSGVLIGPRLVLTAGHVVPWDASSWMMRFFPAYYDGASILGIGADSYVSDARGFDVSYYSQLPDAHDMAILRLYDPLGDSVGYFGSKLYSESWNGQPYWNLTGYPAAIANAERPSYQLGISVTEADASGDALDVEHQGDLTGGDSGGPFWATWPDGFPYVVGTASGGKIITKHSTGQIVKDTNDVAGGNALNDLINWGRTNWP